MMSIIFAVEDSVAKTYGNPFIATNIAVATRDFISLVRQNNTIIASHPGDFRLRKLGTYDSETGEIIPESPTVVANAIDYIVKEVDNG